MIEFIITATLIIMYHLCTAVHAGGVVIIIMAEISEYKKVDLTSQEKYAKQTAHFTALLLNQYKGSAEGFQEDFQEQNKLPAQSSAEFAEAVWVKREFTGLSQSSQKKKKHPVWHF